jgi:hypothetical protein
MQPRNNELCETLPEQKCLCIFFPLFETGIRFEAAWESEYFSEI